MAAQLKCNPTIKITLLREETLDEYAPGYVLEQFHLTKRLLEPNRLEFTMVREEINLEATDIDFELRDELFGAKVEMSLQATSYDIYEDAMEDYDVENFFYGYIQSIKVFRSNSKPVRFQCVAFSPDARLKHFPSCCTFNEYTLRDCVTDVLGLNAGEETVAYQDGEYPDIEGLNMDVNPRFTGKMPYTVQYNESPYDFLKRLAKRYGEYFYYEDGEVVFGEMKEKNELLLHTGTTLESYEYEMSMQHHDGIVFTEHSRESDADFYSGMEKYAEQNTGETRWESGVEPENKFAKSAFLSASEFFNDNYNSIYEMGSTPVTDKVVSALMPAVPTKQLIDYAKDKDYWEDGRSGRYDTMAKDAKGRQKFAEANHFEELTWTNIQRNLLDAYVAADALICTGNANRADLKLGSVITIQDETNTDQEKEDWWEHDPLKVIELTYDWESKKSTDLVNSFKAIAEESTVPPYLHRDEQGLLEFGDFDVYPHCGPQHAVVIDNNDPDKMGRVKVCLLWQKTYGRCVEGESYVHYLEERQCTPWIWVTSQYMGYYHGSHCLPELGDQVLVGFEHNNAERPYVMGSFQSQFGASEYVIDRASNVKFFRSRSGHTFVISDDWDHTGYVRIYDYENHNYEIMLDIDDKLIRIESRGNIELSAGNNIVLHARNDIELNADHNIEINAKNDIRSCAENDIGETAEKNYIISAGTEYQAFVGKKNSDHGAIGIKKDKLRLQVCKEKVVSLDKNKGIETKSDKAISFEAQEKLSLTSHNELNMQSENTAELRGKTKTVVESDLETVVKGKMVKIN